MADKKSGVGVLLEFGGKPGMDLPAKHGEPDGDEGGLVEQDGEKPVDDGDQEEQVAADEMLDALEKKDGVALKDALKSFISICMAKYGPAEK